MRKMISVEPQKTWEDIKQKGSEHYKSDDGAVEPIDLYRSLGILRAYAVTSIIKYAVRNVHKDVVNEKDIAKIQHCAELMRF